MSKKRPNMLKTRRAPQNPPGQLRYLASGPTVKSESTVLAQKQLNWTPLSQRRPNPRLKIIPDDRFAFVAVPLRRRGTGPVIGVVYFDSTDATLFSDPAAPRGDISQPFVVRVATACAGLGLYTELRYAMEAGR